MVVTVVKIDSRSFSTAEMYNSLVFRTGNRQSYYKWRILMIHMWLIDKSYYNLVVEKYCDSIFTTVMIIWKPKGRTIRKVMGGGGPFPACTIIFSKFFAVLIFFFYNPLLEFFFPKNCWRGGGGREVVKKNFQDVKIFSGHKKRGQNNFSGQTSVQLRLKTHFPSQILLKT